MIRRCVYCVPPHNDGEVEPFEDRRLTHGMCSVAAAIENAKVDAWIAAKPVEPLFFADDVAELLPISDRRVTTPPMLAPIRPEWARNSIQPGDLTP